jgi:outer membrane protein OmpA-like peptidoglycan-associated protein
MRNLRAALLVPVLGLVAAGCATKDFVRQTVGQTESKLDAQMGEQSKRIDEQTKRVEAQTAQVTGSAKQLNEVGARVTKVEATVDEVGNIARAASSRADEAFTRADELDGRMSRLLADQSQRTVVETVHVQFRFDRADLTDTAQTALTELIKDLTDNRALSVDLEGYADSRGPAEHNVRLSERRVGAVRRFLVQRGVDVSRINWIGLGELSEGSDRAKNRRVTVRLMLPATQSASPQAGAPTSTDEATPPQADPASESRSESSPAEGVSGHGVELPGATTEAPPEDMSATETPPEKSSN